MQRLVAIIKVMRKGEKRLLRHIYSDVTNGEEQLRLRLFDLIEKGKVTSDAEAKAVLGQKGARSAYSHLKTRLRQDILNVLLLQESPKRIPQPKGAAAFECRKKLAQAFLLLPRGAIVEGTDILRNAKALAEKYELVAESILIDHLVREQVHLIKSQQQLEELNTSIGKNMAVLADIMRSEEISLMMTLPHLFKESEELSEGVLREDRIRELRQLFTRSGSARVGFWYYLAFIEFANRNRMYEEAIGAGQEFIKLVSDNPSIWSKNNLAGANQMLGTAYLSTRDFAAAAEHFTVADRNFPAAGNNRLANLELLFRAQIGLGDHTTALATVERAMAHPRYATKPETASTWLYHQACAQFSLAAFDAAFKSVNLDGFLQKQRDDRNPQFRILEIMILMAQGDQEWVEFKLNTLRKLIARYRNLGTPRVKAAINIISSLLRNGLDFDDLGSKAEEGLQLCLSETEGCVWDPMGPEIVRLDRWVQSKRKDQGL
jgi:tetratricopeptide (TPR) repeat protein